MRTYLHEPSRIERVYPLIYVQAESGQSLGVLDIEETWKFVFLQHENHEGIERFKTFNGRDSHDILEQVEAFVHQLAESYEEHPREQY